MKRSNGGGLVAAAPAGIVVSFCFAIATSCGGPAVQRRADPGEALMEQGRYAEAEDHYQRMAQEKPGDAGVAMNLARVALEQDRPDGAVVWAEKAVALSPKSARAHFWAARAYVAKLQKTKDYMQMGQLAQKTRLSIERSVELDPADPEARMFLAGYCLNAPPIAGGNVAKAKEQAGELANLDPFRGNMMMATILQKEKNAAGAVEAYRRAAEARPASADPYYRIGLLQQQEKNYDEAFEAFECAVAADPKATNAMYQIARTAIYAKRNFDRAIECLNAYLEEPPGTRGQSWAHAHWRLGMIHELRGDLVAARREYEAALALDPKHAEALDALRALGERDGDPAGQDAESDGDDDGGGSGSVD